MKRVVTGVVAAALAAVVVFYLEPAWFVAFAGVVIGLAAFEYGALARRIIASRSIAWALWFAVGLVAVVAGADANRPIDLPLPAGLAFSDVWFAAAAVVLGLAAAVGLGSRADVRDRLLASSLFGFGTLWLGLFLIAAINLHAVSRMLLFWVLAVASLGDVGAYYGGRRFGRRPLAPVLSPKKTIAGAASGLAVSVVTGVLAFVAWRGPDALGADIPVLALLCGAAAQTGDLLASLLKRAAEAKDTGGLLPGHGGVLDRLDSILLAAPVCYVATRLGAAPSLQP